MGSLIYLAPPLLGFLCRYLRGVQISSSDEAENQEAYQFFSNLRTAPYHASGSRFLPRNVGISIFDYHFLRPRRQPTQRNARSKVRFLIDQNECHVVSFSQTLDAFYGLRLRVVHHGSG